LSFVAIAYAGAEIWDLEYHDAQRIAQLILVTAAALFVAVAPPSVPRWVGPTVAGLLLAAGTGGRWSVIECLHLLSLVLLWAVWAERLRAHPEGLLVPLVGLTAFYVFVLCVRWLAMVQNGLTFHVQEFYPGFSNQRFFGHWVSLTAPLIVLAALRAGTWRNPWRYGGELLAALWVCFVFASGTRGSWLALASAGTALCFAGPAARRVAWGIGRAVLAGGLLYLVMFELLLPVPLDTGEPSGLSRISGTSNTYLSRREEMFALITNGLSSRPLLGAGPMGFAATWNTVAAHPHNLFVQAAYEWGIPAALLLLCFVMYTLARQCRQCRRHPDLLRAALFACVVGALAQAQVDGLLVMPFGQTLFVLIAAWLASLERASGEPGAPAGDGVRWSLRGSMLLAAIALWGLVSPELNDLDAWAKMGLQRSELSLLLPRFWSQGFIPDAPRWLNLP
jgi:hypothetical protein